jgi:hypothetical protein
MKQEVNVGSYDATSGIRLEWALGFNIEVMSHSGEVVIRANGAGLISLAQHLLTLAEDSVPSGTHIHLDASRELEDGSADLIIERGNLRWLCLPLSMNLFVYLGRYSKPM